MLTELQEHLAAHENQLLNDGTHHEGLTQTQMVLIMKNPKKGTILSNYQLISWLLSGVIAAKMSKHLAQSGSLHHTNGSLLQQIRNFLVFLVLFLYLLIFSIGL